MNLSESFGGWWVVRVGRAGVHGTSTILNMFVWYVPYGTLDKIYHVGLGLPRVLFVQACRLKQNRAASKRATS